MSSMLISVIVPVYNTESFLPASIESILSQTYQDIELLLIDDGSTDRSGAICDEYAAKDSRVRVFHKENGGVSSARNLGLDQARGEYIHFVDSDDILLQGAYQYIAEVCNSYSPDVISFDYFTDIRDKDALIIDDGKFYDSIQTFTEHFYIRVPVWIKVFKRSYIEKQNTRFEPVIYSEDTIFIWNLLQTDGTIFSTKSKLYSYTTNPCGAEQTRTINHVQRTVESLIVSNLRVKEFVSSYSECPPVISNFTHKYEVLFNRILCTPYTYCELKSLFAKCAKIGTSHLAQHREIKTYDFLYHHPLIFYIFQSFIRKFYFHRHKIAPDSGDFLDRMIKKDKS